MKNFERLQTELKRLTAAHPKARFRLSVEYTGVWALFVIDYRQTEGNPQRILADSFSFENLDDALGEICDLLQTRQ